MPTPLLPDPVVAARTALLAQPTLTALVADRIYWAIPSDPPPTYPLLVVSSVNDDEDGRPDGLVATVQVDVWGVGKSVVDVNDCRTVARTLRSVARDLKGTWGTASIYNAVAGQIIPNPDPAAGRARFVVDLELHLQ